MRRQLLLDHPAGHTDFGGGSVLQPLDVSDYPALRVAFMGTTNTTGVDLRWSDDDDAAPPPPLPDAVHSYIASVNERMDVITPVFAPWLIFNVFVENSMIGGNYRAKIWGLDAPVAGIYTPHRGVLALIRQNIAAGASVTVNLPPYVGPATLAHGTLVGSSTNSNQHRGQLEEQSPSGVWREIAVAGWGRSGETVPVDIPARPCRLHSLNNHTGTVSARAAVVAGR